MITEGKLDRLVTLSAHIPPPLSDPEYYHITWTGLRGAGQLLLGSWLDTALRPPDWREASVALNALRLSRYSLGLTQLYRKPSVNRHNYHLFLYLKHSFCNNFYKNINKLPVYLDSL
jgi:hypothetical protein